MDFSEKWGKDVEDAVRLALHDLKLERDQVEVIVLEEPSKGFFGLGSKLAKVRVQKLAAPVAKAAVTAEKEIPSEKREGTSKNRPERQNKPQREEAEKVEKVEKIDKIEKIEKIENDVVREPRREGQREKSRKPRNRQSGQREREDDRYSLTIREKPADLKEVQEAAGLDFLRDVTSRMGLDLTVKAYANDSCLYFEIAGPDSGTIIGKRGQTLDSIQYLTSLVANKDKEKYLRVIVDAENYRTKRERTLEQLANRLADKVQKSGKSVRLEPMNPYERKVIHATLQKNGAVTTRSEGEEPYRRVIIERK